MAQSRKDPLISVLICKLTWKNRIQGNRETINHSVPGHCHKVQTMAQQEVLDFWGLQSTLFQIGEQGRASYTPERHSKTQLSQANMKQGIDQ